MSVRVTECLEIKWINEITEKSAEKQKQQQQQNPTIFRKSLEGQSWCL